MKLFLFRLGRVLFYGFSGASLVALAYKVVKGR